MKLRFSLRGSLLAILLIAAVLGAARQFWWLPLQKKSAAMRVLRERHAGVSEFYNWIGRPKSPPMPPPAIRGPQNANRVTAFEPLKPASASESFGINELLSASEAAHAIRSISFVRAPEPVTDDDLKLIAAIESIEYLDLTKIESTRTRRNGTMSVTARNIGAPRITDAGIAHIAKMPNLKFLNIGQSQISDHGCSVLAQSPSLQILALTETKISDSGLAAIAALKSLRELDVRGTLVSDDAIREFQRLRPDVDIMPRVAMNENPTPSRTELSFPALRVPSGSSHVSDPPSTRASP